MEQNRLLDRSTRCEENLLGPAKSPELLIQSSEPLERHDVIQSFKPASWETVRSDQEGFIKQSQQSLFRRPQGKRYPPKHLKDYVNY